MAQRRTFTCQAAGCGKLFTSLKPNARYCSVRCKTASGRWSYPANEHAPIVYRGAEGV